MFMPDNTKFEVVRNPNMQETRTENDRLEMEKRLHSFQEVEQTYTAEQAENEMARCLKCPTHWCQRNCPAGVPVTDFIARARSGDYEGAYRLIRSASTLPEFCSRLCPQEKQCQSECTRSIRSMAVGIGKLERYVVEQHYASGIPELSAPSTGKRVAVVGSGPSGLSAAQRLADLGHEVVVFERRSCPGGLLEYGIPNTKLDKGILERKIHSMEQQGVKFRTGADVGKEIPAAELSAGYDAVVLAVGTGVARTLKLEGMENVKGICPAVEYLSSFAGHHPDSGISRGEEISPQGKDVVIVGGGDTGSDCVGASIRGGCASLVQIEMLPRERGHVYIHDPYIRRSAEARHDSSLEEYRAAFGGGDPHRYQTTLKAVQADGSGRLRSVTAVSLEPVYDAHFRLTMREIPGTEQELPCQLLIIAAGFLGAESYVAESFGVRLNSGGRIAARVYATAADGTFVCGDCRTGQSLVVKAMADGRDCADAVDAYLKG